MHFSNGRFSNKETGFSGPYVVWSLLGAPGEKKKERILNVFIAPAKKLPPTTQAFFTKKGTFRATSKSDRRSASKSDRKSASKSDRKSAPKSAPKSASKSASKSTRECDRKF